MHDNKTITGVGNAGTHGHAFGPTHSSHRAASLLAGEELYTRTDCRKNLPAAAWSHLAEFNSCYASTQIAQLQ
jgi:hypothetical protein